MSAQPETLTFTVTFHGPFRVARGEAAGGADATVDRRTPLPASSLKGLMRGAAANFLRIPDPWLADVFGTDTGKDQPGTELGTVLDQWCWSDPHIDQDKIAIGRAARARLQSDGTIMDGHLLIGEQAWVNQPVSFTVTRLGPIDPADVDAHRLILRSSARAVLALGGQRRRGSGWVTIADDIEWTDDDSRALLNLTGRTPTRPRPSLVGTATITAPPPRNPPIHLTYRLLLRSTVTAGAGSEVGNAQRGHQVLPGSVVRGALAAAWLREHDPSGGGDGARLATLFERDLSVGPAVPVGSRLVPLSHFRLKYPVPGTSNDWVDAAAFDDDPPEPGVEFGRGWQVPPEHTVRITRTALDSDGTARDGSLFTETGLRAGVVAVGRISAATDDADAVAWLRQARTLRVGGRRSTGGACDWTVHDDGPAEPTGTDPGTTGSLLLRCLTPMVLVDRFGAPAVDRATVQDTFTETAGQPLTIGRDWTRTRTVEGWHTASGLPKVADWAIEAGSVFEVKGLDAAGARRLAGGVGLRRQEGFGRVEVCRAGALPPPVTDPVPSGATGSPQHPAGGEAEGTAPKQRPILQPPAEEESAPQATTGPDTAEPARQAPPAKPSSFDQPPPVTLASTLDQRVDDLIAAVGSAQAPQVLKGIADEARRIANFRASGMDAVAIGAARNSVKLAWARDRSTTVQLLITALLLDEKVSQVRDVAVRRAGELD